VWWRAETFGAWVRLEDGSLVAVDHALRARLGLDPQREHAAVPLPLEAHIAVTRRCDADCPDCYQQASPDGDEPPAAQVLATLREVAALGVSTVAFGGGEPMLRKDLAELARAASQLGMVAVTTTSGRHVQERRARELAAFAQLNVSHPADGQESAAALAEGAIGYLARAGLRVGVNVVVRRGTPARLRQVASRCRDLGARELQLLRFKPAGRGRARAHLQQLEAGELELLCRAVQELSESAGIAVRIDCALVPLLQELLSEPQVASRVMDAGLFGCEAARWLVGVGVDGALWPCSCWPGAAGQGGWTAAPELARLRAWHGQLPEPCASCPLGACCRGGCQVVSLSVMQDFGPDPGCPRVKKHTAADRGAPAR
jgi:radical SAM protein with 4Fe4S-binding SPASM domain